MRLPLTSASLYYAFLPASIDVMTSLLRNSRIMYHLPEVNLLPWYTEVINKYDNWWLKKSSYVKSFISISWTLGLWDLLPLLSCQMYFLSFDIGDWDRRWTFDLYIDAKKLWGGWCIWIITSALVLFLSFDIRYWDWRWTWTQASQNSNQHVIMF